MTAKETRRSLRRTFSAILLALILTVMAIFLLFSETASRAAFQGILLCGRTLIPAVFPCLVLSKLLIKLGFAEILGRKIGRLFSRLFGVSAPTVAAFLCGCLGGFPTGAASVFQLRRDGQLDDSDTVRGLILSSSASPAFLIGTVGCILLDRPLRGLFLYVAQLLAILIVGLMLQFVHRRKLPLIPYTPHRAPRSLLAALAESLRESADTMLAVCGTVIFFTAAGGILLSLSFFSNPIRCLLLASLELTAGISLTASLLTADQAFVAIAAAVGFSGLSVHAQTALVGEGQFPSGRFLAGKALTSLITALMAAVAVFLNLV